MKSNEINLVPQSILARNTDAIDATFTDRLNYIGAGQLLIDMENERDMFKLTLYMQQFGIPSDVLPSDMTDFEFRNLLQNILHIYHLSGTIESMQLLAIALGATGTTIIRNAFTLDYDCQSRHNQQFRYNQGREYRSFVVDATISGVSEVSRVKFESTYRKLFKVFEPVSVFLRGVGFE